MAAAPDRMAASDGEWRLPRTVVAVRCPALGRTRLLSWALDVNVEEHDPTVADQRVLKALFARMLEDLAGELEEALDVPKNREAGDGDDTVLLVDLADSNGLKLLSFAVPPATIVTLRKALAGAPATARGGLTPILIAAASAEVTLDVVVGRAQAGLADVRALAAGDVLVLETPLSGDVQLVAPGGAVAVAQLVEHEGRRSLALQSIVKSASKS
jgi:flagellar motor switch protein FliM